jgi:hypothetical protein
MERDLGFFRVVPIVMLAAEEEGEKLSLRVTRLLGRAAAEIDAVKTGGVGGENVHDPVAVQIRAGHRDGHRHIAASAVGIQRRCRPAPAGETAVGIHAVPQVVLGRDLLEAAVEDLVAGLGLLGVDGEREEGEQEKSQGALHCCGSGMGREFMFFAQQGNWILRAGAAGSAAFCVLQLPRSFLASASWQP